MDKILIKYLELLSIRDSIFSINGAYFLDELSYVSFIRFLFFEKGSAKFK